jgi:hypothetical protein
MENAEEAVFDGERLSAGFFNKRPIKTHYLLQDPFIHFFF